MYNQIRKLKLSQRFGYIGRIFVRGPYCRKYNTYQCYFVDSFGDIHPVPIDFLGDTLVQLDNLSNYVY